ncbi:long-chain-fatty-acid--CoA ligase [Nocardia sp. NPDC052278]|uniref:long-chain-fatty-acid--CoA ligase n=1 Tax=unclassified Nocardia TaxID=2637762 RepID=UPI003691E078
MTATQPQRTAIREQVWPKRLPRRLAIPDTTLWFNLEVTERRYPDKSAYIFFGRAMTYRELRSQAERVAGWLHSVGVGAGDRVAVMMQNSPQFVVAVYGILRANAVVVPINPMNRGSELQHYLSDAEPKAFICAADLAETVHAAAHAAPFAHRLHAVLVTRYADAMPLVGEVDPAELPTERIEAWLRSDPAIPDGYTRWNDALEQGLAPGPLTAGPDDLAVLPYTSGTTGHPKGCLHTHRSLMSNTITGVIGHTTVASVGLAVVPFFHITGLMSSVLGVVFNGATSVILPRWDRELAGRLISRYSVTHWTCIPTMIIDLMASPHYRTFDLSNLVQLSGGGAAMPKMVAERLERDFDITFSEAYGLTETAGPTHFNPSDRAKNQCLGIPMFDVDSRVVDPDTNHEVPLGTVGEIVTRGPMVFQGYWRDPEATQAAFIEIDGEKFLRTGDLGWIDDEGYFFVADRLKRMINASGFKVWPAEVEAVLFQHPAVQEACVISAKDDYRGETVKAIIVLRPEVAHSTTATDIIEWARNQMAAYKTPRIVEFVASLPKSAAGKIMWRTLQEQEGA